jgi:CBS domain containing-hemolysin-like protein
VDGSTFVDGTITIVEFNRQFHSDIPEAPDYETLVGYLHVVTGHLPDLNEEIQTADFQFTIASKSARRIRQIKVTPTLLPASGREPETPHT